MGPAPTLSAYQQAAQAIYAPQLQSDITMAQNTEQGDIANQETSKGQINTDYQTAVQNLTDTTNANVAKINQLYTQRLGGNFSGLQGNDLGQMFSTASKNQSTIESDRANKLAAIATTEANDQDTYNATVQSLTSKYQGEEAAEANSEYNTAMNNYNSQQLSLEKSEISAASKASTASTAASDKYKVTTVAPNTGAKGYTGPNGQTNLYQYALGTNGGADANIDDVLGTIQEELSTGTTTDKGAATGITNLQNQGLSSQQILNRLSKSNAYIFQ